MIKKSVFEDDLISGMERELHAQHTQRAQDGVAQGMEHLRSAADILDKAGLTSRANAVRNILHKMSQVKKHKPAQDMPSLDALMMAGVTQRDLEEFLSGKPGPVVKAKVNNALRDLGRTDKEIIHFIGKHNFVSEEDAAALLDPNRNLGKMWDWMKNPQTPVDPANPRPEEFEETDLMKDLKEGKPISLKPPTPQSFQITPLNKNQSPSGDLEGEELVFKRLAQAFQEAHDEADARSGKHKHPKSKVHDPHTSGLTSEKMVENYKQYGVPFNMSDDGLLDVEVADDRLEVQDGDLNSEMDFEDEI